MRAELARLMGRKTHRCPFKLPDRRVVQRYNESGGKTTGPNLDDLRPDVFGGAHSLWNQACGTLLAKHMRSQQPFADLWSVDDIVDAYTGHLPGLKLQAKAEQLERAKDEDADERRAVVASRASKNNERCRKKPVRLILPIRLQQPTRLHSLANAGGRPRSIAATRTFTRIQNMWRRSTCIVMTKRCPTATTAYCASSGGLMG